MTQITLAAAAPFIGWSRLWRLESPAEEAAQAWRELGLPDDYSHWFPVFNSFFEERISMDASHCSEVDAAALSAELGRICRGLELSWEGVDLPWHHVSALCEILAYAVERDETAVAAALARDYLLPWCESVERVIVDNQPDLAFLTEDFAQDLVGRVELDASRDGADA